MQLSGNNVVIQRTCLMTFIISCSKIPWYVIPIKLYYILIVVYKLESMHITVI